MCLSFIERRHHRVTCYAMVSSVGTSFQGVLGVGKEMNNNTYTDVVSLRHSANLLATTEKGESQEAVCGRKEQHHYSINL